MEDSNRAMEVTKLFKEVAVLFRQNMSKLFEEIGVTVPQSMVIGILERFGEMKISALSDMVGLSNSTVSGILDRLEKQGVVERIRSEEDKRVVYVRLTTKFEEVHQDFHRKADQYMESIINKATPEDHKIIIDGLNALKKILSE